MSTKAQSVCKDEVYRKIYSDHALSLRNFLYYQFGDFEKARDYTQEAFIRLWHNCLKVEVAKAKSFLFTVAKRLFLDDIDHQKVVLKFRQKPSRDANQESPDYIMEENEFRKELETAISNLPEKQRVIFLMNRIDKLSYKEIASLQDISVKTVEKHMSSALKRLKESVEALGIFKI